ncbi:kinetochore-associated Ndc80 complex subunit nuf2 [Glugoides intestinalis]
MNRRNIYTVPDLSTKEIISYLSDLNISISPSDILKPSPAVTAAIYDSLLEVYEGKGSPDEEEETLQTIKQVQRMGSLLEKIGIANFTIRDLNPDSRRLVQILSTLINFGMYRDNKKQIYEQASKIADTNFAVKNSLENQLAEAKREILDTQNRIQENAKIRENLENEIINLENELKEFYKYQKEKMNEVGLLKTEKIEIGDKLCSSQLLEHNLKQEITCLKAQIVNDPTKLLELVEEMRSLIEKERESIRNIEKSIQDQNASSNKQKKLKEQLLKLHTVVKELNDAEEKVEKIEQGIVMSESKLKNWDSSINALKIRINHIERQISHLETKIFNLQSKDKKTSEEISTKISNLRTKYDAVNEEREQLLEKVRNNNKMVQEVMFEKAKKSGEHERECSEIAGLLVHFSGDAEGFFNRLKNIINQ